MLSQLYSDTRIRIAELVDRFDEAQLSTVVPATPDWTVRHLIAHLVGVAADGAAGRLDGAAESWWTARHVAERAELPVAELLAEWDHTAPVIEAALAGQDSFTGPNAAADAICHEADLREALGLPAVDRKDWQLFFEVMMRGLQLRLRSLAKAQPILVCDEDGGRWPIGEISGPDTAMLRADAYELLRATFSRRSRSQIAGWDWMPAAVPDAVERFGFFGPRDDDQPVPRR